MNPSVLSAFAGGLLTSTEVTGKRVLEVGAADMNGSVRPIIEAHGPASYLGVDSAAGPRVDRVVDCTDLVAVFGKGSFDVVISTEMLEHVRDWKAAMLNLAGVLVEGGVLAVTTRSPGFPYHAHPEDHWRFPVPVMADILVALRLDVLACHADPSEPGVIAKAHKPAGWSDPGMVDVTGVERMEVPSHA